MLTGALVLMALLVAVVALRPAGSRIVPVTAEDGTSGYGDLPLSFVPNKGQSDRQVRFLANTGGASFYFTDNRVAIVLRKGDRSHALHLRFLGANENTRLLAADPARAKSNYLSASERHTDIPTYSSLAYRDLWPGIDMKIRGSGGSLKYEFHLAPGADPSRIRLAYSGASGLSLKNGALRVETPLGAVTDRAPRSFQRSGKRQVPVESSYVLRGEAYGFAVGPHDPSHPLVIDPELAYSTFLGGSVGDEPNFGGRMDIAVDGQGSAYVTGATASPDYPTTPGAFDTTYEGGGFYGDDVYVTKLSPDGSSLVYSTFLDGDADDAGLGIAVDDQQNAYVVGYTRSTDFPTTPGAFDTTAGGSTDGFVTKLNAAGSELVYSTHLGGNDSDNAYGVVVDALGSAYVVATSASTDFPTTPGAYDTSVNGSSDGTVTKLNPAGSGLLYSTYIGGSDFDLASDIDLDVFGNTYITGSADSSDFPTTPGAYDTSVNGSSDGTVTKLNPAGSGLVYSTFMGGSETDSGHGISVDEAGNAYVAGTTFSPNFPTTMGSGLGFMAKLNATGSSLGYSVRVDGFALDAAVDSEGSMYVTGGTHSTSFPTTPDALQPAYNGTEDAFFLQLDPDGSSFLYSTYLGGQSLDEGSDLALDPMNNAYLIGVVQSPDFPTTPGAYDTSFNGGNRFTRLDAFVTKFSFGSGPPAALDLSPETATNTVATEHCVSAAVADAAGEPSPGVIVRFTVTGSVDTSGSQITDQQGQASFCYQGPVLPGDDEIVAFADTNADGDADVGEPADQAQKTWAPPVSTPGCTTSNRGRIVASNGDQATFSGKSRTSGSGQASGREMYVDRGPADRVVMRSLSVDVLVCSGQDASAYGWARVNHQELDFRIDLHDGRGRRRDTYRILLEDGYDSGAQTLRSGHVKVRR